MALTRLVTSSFSNSSITDEKLTQSVRQLKITSVTVTDENYITTGNTSVNSVSGGYIVITGENFESGSTVTIEEDVALSVIFVSSTTLRVQVNPKSSGTYNVYVSTTDGRTASKFNGITFSNTPFWFTSSDLPNQQSGVPFNINLQANGASSYANTTVLPEGTTLLANGYYYGTISSLTANTAYNFIASATDASTNTTTKRFKITVTV